MRALNFLRAECSERRLQMTKQENSKVCSALYIATGGTPQEMSHCELLNSYTQCSVYCGREHPSLPYLCGAKGVGRCWLLLHSHWTDAIALWCTISLRGGVGGRDGRGEERERGRRIAEARKWNTCCKTAIHKQDYRALATLATEDSRFTQSCNCYTKLWAFVI